LRKIAQASYFLKGNLKLETKQILFVSSFNYSSISENISKKGKKFSADASFKNDQKPKYFDIVRSLSLMNFNTTMSNSEVKKAEENFEKLLAVDVNVYKEKLPSVILTLQNLAKLNLGNLKILKNKRRELSLKLASFCLENFKSLNQLDVLMLLWSCVRMEIYSEELLKQCLEYLKNGFFLLSEKDVVTYIFSVARLVEQNGGLIDKVDGKCLVKKHIDEVRTRLQKKIVDILSSSENQQHITNVIWAVDRLELYKEEEVLRKCEEVFKREGLVLNDTNFAIILNSFVHMNHVPAHVYEYFVQEFYARQKTLVPKTFTSIVRALFLSKVGDLGEVMQNSQEYIRRNLSGFSPQDLVALLLPLAIIRDYSQVTNAIITRCQENLNRLRSDDLCKLLWALVVLEDASRVNLWYQIADRLTEREISKLGVVEMHQISQGFLSLIFYAKNDSNCSKETLSLLEQKYEKTKQTIREKTLLERHEKFAEEKEGVFSVYLTLQKLGFQVVPECIAEIYNVDFVLFEMTKERLLELEEKISKKEINLEDSSSSIGTAAFGKGPQMLKESDDKSKLILIEVNGKHHFIGSTPRVKGSTYLKTHQLKALGYNYLSLSHQKLFHLSALESANERALALIQLLLQSLSPNSLNE